jgi:hypothetical protein
MMKQSGTIFCLWAMLVLIGPATTAANDDPLGRNEAKDEYEQETYDGPYRGRRVAKRQGPFGELLDNAGVQTWGSIPAVRSTYQETGGEGETRTLRGKKSKSGGR